MRDNANKTIKALFYDVGEGFITLYAGENRQCIASFNAQDVIQIINVGDWHDDIDSKLEDK